MSSRTALLADSIVKEHDTGHDHPERPERFDAALKGLSHWGLTRAAPRAADHSEIALCHVPKYIRTVEREIREGFSELSTGDTLVGAHSLEAARRAVGTVLNAVDLVCTRGFQNAFCVVRPPGHHATPTRGMGFCIFNNVAIGARYAQHKHGVGHVLIADWDVHHGNGTQDIFYEDGSVFFFSTHQSPWYPGTGAAFEMGCGRGQGTTLNCPFPAGSGRHEILGAFKERLLPAMEEFKPELVIVSAGFDSRVGDPLGRFMLNDSDFGDLTGVLLEIGETYASGRVISVLEGGYNLDGLEKAVHAHAARLQALRFFDQ